MRAFKAFVLTVSTVALSGPVFAQKMVIDPFPDVQPEAQVSPSSGASGDIPEMPDQAALSPATSSPVVHGSAVLDDVPPLPGSQYFKPVPVQEIQRQDGARASVVNDFPETVERQGDVVHAEVVPSHSPSAPDFMPEESRDPDGAWSVRANENLHQVLLRWSNAVGVEVIWDCRDDIPVLEALDTSGSYARAVGALLDQYEGHEIRPVGQLHVDPQTHERILVVSLAENR